MSASSAITHLAARTNTGRFRPPLYPRLHDRVAWSAALFAVGAILAAVVFRRGAPQAAPAAEPVFAH